MFHLHFYHHYDDDIRDEIRQLRRIFEMGLEDIKGQLQAVDAKLDEQSARIATLENEKETTIADLTAAKASLEANVAALQAEIAGQDQAVQDALAPAVDALNIDVGNLAAIGQPPTT